jgi:hypothetical protein
MASPSRRRAPSADSPLRKARARLGAIDAAGVVAELRDLHEKAGDPNVERMPTDYELWGALVYAEKHALRLAGHPELLRKAALNRVRLWEYIRERADIHQSRAVQTAQQARAEWADLAEPLAVGGASGAYNKARRLLAAEMEEGPGSEGPVRRTPEAVSRVERERAAARRAESEEQRREQLRQEVTVRVARGLVAVRGELRGGEEVDYWLDQVKEVLKDCRTPTQFVALARYVSAASRELAKAEADDGQGAGGNTAVEKALSAVRAWERG